MNVTASAPGRICLFGEHQDYFGFPVTAAAIDLRGTVVSSSRTDRTVHLDLPEVNESHQWSLDALPEPSKRNYWLAALHLARREGWMPQTGWNATVTSAIPQRAGASSSSALTAAWCALVAERAGFDWDQEWVAHAAWRTEVQWFGEPGGKMDQVMCSVGGVKHVEFEPAFRVQPLPVPEGTWVLLDSCEPKDTLGVLSRAKHRRLELLSEWGVRPGAHWPNALPDYPVHWDSKDRSLMEATVGIRKVSNEGTAEVSSGTKDLRALGRLLTEHHGWLSKGIEVSTSRIDRALVTAIEAGAFGGKINGSGGGGTAFVVCPPEAVAAVSAAVKALGMRPIPIRLGEEGVRTEHIP